MKKVRALVIGVGYMGSKHIGAYIQNKDVVLVGLVCKTSKSARRAKIEYHVPTFTSLSKAIKETKPDIASICTPTETHYEIAKKCIESGIDVMIEKPICNTVTEAVKLKRVADRLGRLILCAHTELLNDNIIYFLNEIDKCKSRIKKISFVKFGNDVSPKHKGESFVSSKSVLYDRLVHMSYILDAITKGGISIVDIKSRSVGKDKELIDADLTMNGIPINLRSEYHKEFPLFKCVFVELGNREKIAYLLNKGKENVLVNGKIVKLKYGDVFDNMVCFFLDEIKKKEEKREYRCSIDNAIRTMEICFKLVNGNKIRTSNGYPSTRAILKVGYTCNNNCGFCHSNLKKGYKQISSSDIISKISSIQGKVNTIIVSGGEPTIRKDFFGILDTIKAFGFSVGVNTNGRMFSNSEFFDTFSLYDPSFVLVSLHGATAKTHDRITGVSGSFCQTIKGIKHLSKLKCDKIINYVINSINISDIPDFLMLAKEYGCKVKLSFVEPINGFDNKGFIPKMSDAMDMLKVEAGNGFKFRVDGFPLCVVDKSLKLDNLQTNSIQYISEVSDGEFCKSDCGNKVKTKKCNGCSLYKKCEGVYLKYLEIYGDSEFDAVN